MVNIQDLFDDAKCYHTVRDMRWPDGVTCPRCSSPSVIENGRDDTEPHRKRYECKACRQASMTRSIPSSPATTSR
jgi:transposase-like protein